MRNGNHLLNLVDCKGVDYLFRGSICVVPLLVSRDLTVARTQEGDGSVQRNGADLRGIRGEADRQIAVGYGRKWQRGGCEGLVVGLIKGDHLINLVDRKGVDYLFRSGVGVIALLVCRDLAVARTQEGDDSVQRNGADQRRIRGEADRQFTLS